MGQEISVVIPMRNESPNVEALYRELTTTLGGFGRSYEILAIDDGSTDDTFALLAAIQAKDPRLRVIRFRRNFGQTAAFAAGFANARGRYIVTADGDRQNDPADIPAMWTTGVHLNDYGCSLKVFRAEIVKPMKLYGEMHRFLPAIASEFGVSIGELVVNHRARTHGKSNYGITRTFRVILDLVTVKFLISYSTRPLQMFGGVGLIMGTLGTLICGWLAYQRLLGYESIANRPLLLLGIMMILGGLQLLSTGLMAEMLSRTYHESQDKPTYVVREVRESASGRTREVIGA